MYEEEDDDLPMQYRRLTAHLQTNSVDFNRRLAAYLTNQVAMRSAMEQLVQNNQLNAGQYNNQYTNAAQFAAQGQQPMYQSPMASHTMPPTPTGSYRSAPYPSPHQPGFRQMHGRAYSMAAPNELPSSQSASKSPLVKSHSPEGRRMSTPSQLQSAHPSSIKTEGIKPDPDYQRQTQSASMAQYPQYQDMSMFTTSLDPGAQQLLGGTMDPNDPFTSSLMAGSENYISNPYYPWTNMQAQGKMGSMTPSFIHPSYNGMSATLAPSALDNSTSESGSATTGKSGTPYDSTRAPSSGFDFSLSQENNAKGFHYPESQGLTSGQATPGDGFWDAFVQDGQWTEEPATT